MWLLSSLPLHIKCVFGINEAKSLEKEDRIREEYHTANKLMTDLQSTHRPTHVRRLGEYKPNQKNPRPVRMIFSNQKERDDVIENYRTIRRLDQEEQDLDSKISIKRDMTRLEQKEDTDLYKEWKAKKEQSKNSGDGITWVRRNGKVCQAPARRPTINKTETVKITEGSLETTESRGAAAALQKED